MVFKLDTAATKLAEEGQYELVVTGVPTEQSAKWAALSGVKNVVLSVGKMETGGLGWSSAQLMPKMPLQVVPTGKNLLEFSSTALTLKRGTYTVNAVCIKPATGRFIADVSAKPANAAFKLLPAAVSASMGDS